MTCKKSSNDPLVALADTLNWEEFDNSFEKYYSDNGRPAKPWSVAESTLANKINDRTANLKTVRES